MHVYQVLRRPLVTEKSTALQVRGKYAFEVAEGSNKPQIKEAVEKAFKVKVRAVNVITMPGKSRKMGKFRTKSRPWKKAIVTLEPGQKIEFFEGI